MKKHIIIIFMILLSGILHATEARINGLALPDYFVHDDDTLVRIYPAQLTNYQNMAQTGNAGTIGNLDFTVGNVALGIRYADYTGLINGSVAYNKPIFTYFDMINI
jgi:hypothetical protein